MADDLAQGAMWVRDPAAIDLRAAGAIDLEILAADGRAVAAIGLARSLVLVLAVIDLRLAIDLELERELEIGRTLADGQVWGAEIVRELVAAIGPVLATDPAQADGLGLAIVPVAE